MTIHFKPFRFGKAEMGILFALGWALCARGRNYDGAVLGNALWSTDDRLD
jgi:hypothetical protein